MFLFILLLSCLLKILFSTHVWTKLLWNSDSSVSLEIVLKESDKHSWWSNNCIVECMSEILLAILALYSDLILAGGSGERSAKKVGDKLVTAYEKGDADAMVDLMDKEYYKLYNRIRSYTGSDDYVKDTFNEQVSDMVDEVGKVKSIKVEDRSEKEYDEDKLKDVNDTFDMLDVDMTVDKCYEVDLDVKIKGSTDESDGEIIYTVIKTGGKWYLVDYDLYVY